MEDSYTETGPYLDEEDLKSLREQMEEQDFKANGADYEDFIAGPLWGDLRTMLNERIDSLRDKLEEVDNTAKVDTIYKSRLHELRQLLKYPEHVIELFKVTKEEPDESTELAA